MEGGVWIRESLLPFLNSLPSCRKADTARSSPPAVMVLLECQRCCPEIFDRIEVYVDGGIRRGTDVLKCLCLGATAVGMGRPFLFALNYGQDGIEHLIDSRSLSENAIVQKTKILMLV